MIEKNNIRKVIIYNSLTRKKELFISKKPGYIGMYVCGPTVYDYIHLGNCRTFIIFDIIYRYFKHIGYKIRYVRNITDIGHLEDEFNDNSEDKIIKKSIIEKIEPMEVSQKYILNFHKVMNLFNTIPPSIEPLATGHIIEQIELIKNIISKKLAYNLNGSVYFNIERYNSIYKYGQLGNIKLNNSKYRSSYFDEKRNFNDFALWKKKSLTHIMHWISPWGNGYPGWHTECTAMSIKYLGSNFDIHGGGMDLKFPHHECEIAQAYAIYNKPLSNYWIHANILTLDGKKMSKSTGNFILPEDIFNGKNKIFNKSFNPAVVKLCILQSHYRSILDFSQNSLLIAEKNYNLLLNAIKLLKNINPYKYSNFNIILWIEKCYEALSNDFNTPILIAHLLKITKIISLITINRIKLNEKDLNILKKTINNFFFEILGLESNEIKINDKLNKQEIIMKSLIDIIIEIRKKIRKEKNWKLSDDIRYKLENLGIIIKDNKLY